MAAPALEHGMQDKLMAAWDCLQVQYCFFMNEQFCVRVFYRYFFFFSVC